MTSACHKCDTQIPSEANFCPKCGCATFACPKCNIPIPPEANFCPKCGSVVNQSQSGGTISTPGPQQHVEDVGTTYNDTESLFDQGDEDGTRVPEQTPANNKSGAVNSAVTASAPAVANHVRNGTPLLPQGTFPPINAICPACGSNAVQKATMIVTTGTSTGDTRTFGVGMDSNDRFGMFHANSTTTTQTVLAEQCSYYRSRGIRMMGCAQWLLIIVGILFVCTFDPRGLLSGVLSLIFAFSVWITKRSKIENEMAEYQNWIQDLWVCLTCGHEWRQKWVSRTN